MSKYDPLRGYLTAHPGEVSMSFEQIDRLVDGLPPSASRWRAWWANDRTHVHALAWLDSGHRVETVDFGDHHVVFTDA